MQSEMYVVCVQHQGQMGSLCSAHYTLHASKIVRKFVNVQQNTLPAVHQAFLMRSNQTKSFIAIQGMTLRAVGMLHRRLESPEDPTLKRTSAG